MSKVPLYQEIAEAIRQEIVHGSRKPDEALPTVREMAEGWGCSPGTVLRAYQELADQRLVVSRPGAGTRVAPATRESPDTPLRKAQLINQAEVFLLRTISSGYTVQEIEPAFQLALDRYRALVAELPVKAGQALLFVGSHDPAVSLLATRLAEQNSDHHLHVSFAGSLGGLIALAQKRAQIAGAHLWDEETDSYNRPFVRRLLPEQRVALVTLASRHIGLMVASGNPLKITGLVDLTRTDVRFINRQRGAGTRVWLDNHLRRLKIRPERIQGYDEEAQTHGEVASAIHEERAIVGLGIETAALAYGLDFIRLTTEVYDLVIPDEAWDHETVQALVALLQTDAMITAIDRLGGYDTSQTGAVAWVP